MLSTSTIFGFKTYAPNPVWSGSVAGPVKYRPLPKREAVRLYHRARAFNRQTRLPGRQSGVLGRDGLAVLHALIFDFLRPHTGRLDPGYKAIAYAADLSVRSVARGLRKLKEAGVLNWLRRCNVSVDEAGRVSLAQATNAYSICPSSQWNGYREPPAALPEAGAWGDHPCGARDPLTEALAERRHGVSAAAIVRRLNDADADEGPEGALLGLARAVFSRSARPA